jgi:hypothetical protein
MIAQRSVLDELTCEEELFRLEWIAPEVRCKIEIVATNPQGSSQHGAVELRRYTVDEKVTPAGGVRNAVRAPGVHSYDINVVSRK